MHLFQVLGHWARYTLVAPNYIVTAAHVVKNDLYEIPDPNDWKFYLHDDFGEASSSQIYFIEEIKVHPVWTARQTTSNSLGMVMNWGLISHLPNLAVQ